MITACECNRNWLLLTLSYSLDIRKKTVITVTPWDKTGNSRSGIEQGAFLMRIISFTHFLDTYHFRFCAKLLDIYCHTTVKIFQLLRRRYKGQPVSPRKPSLAQHSGNLRFESLSLYGLPFSVYWESKDS